MHDQLHSKITDIRHQFDAFLAEANAARGATPEAAAAAFERIAQRLRVVEASLGDQDAAKAG